MFYVYILKSKKDQKFYTGLTSNLRDQAKRHARKNPTTTTERDKLIEVVFTAVSKIKIVP